MAIGVLSFFSNPSPYLRSEEPCSAFVVCWVRQWLQNGGNSEELSGGTLPRYVKELPDSVSRTHCQVA